jgi:hypothetical protein
VLGTVFAVQRPACLTTKDDKPNIIYCVHFASSCAAYELWAGTDAEQQVHTWLLHCVNVVNSIGCLVTRTMPVNAVSVASLHLAPFLGAFVPARVASGPPVWRVSSGSTHIWPPSWI